MKKLILCLILALLTFCGCEAESDGVENTEDTSLTAGEEADLTQNSDISAKTVCNTGILAGKELFTERDLTQTADADSAQIITVSDNTEAEITEAGTYILSGSARDFTVKITADSKAKIQLILDGVEITNDGKPAVYVESADKVFLTTAAGSVNTISVTGEFDYEDEGADGAVFSRADLVLNGEGGLNVSSSENGVVSKDDMKITGGNYTVSAGNNAFEANDSIRICGGNFTVTQADDGFHASNSDDGELGYIYVSGGEFSLTTTGDGLQGNAFVQIDGGKFDITSAEGIEGTTVQINGGDISISASDDGINASEKSGAYEVLAEFNGGKVTIVMGQGDTDGIDSNGRIVVNGGEINVMGQSAFDYDTSAEFNGGTIIINGEEVDEIPEPMMGGGFGRGGGRGGKEGDFNPGDKRGDFDPENKPEDFNPENGRGDFNPENKPNLNNGSRPDRPDETETTA